ncbi:MAG: hypothetical protein PHF97_07025 [Bacteroidales bacterium]|nr:hypothetical protein [Bacteroidales bacterium]
MNTCAKKHVEPDGSIKSRQGFEIFSPTIPMQNPLSRQGQHAIMNARTKKHVEPDGSNQLMGLIHFARNMLNLTVQKKSRQGFEIFSSMIPMQNPLSRQGQHTIMNTRTKKYVEPDGSNQLMGWSILLEIC